MKFVLACISLLATLASAKLSPEPVASRPLEMNDIKADSNLGMKLLGEARKLEEGGSQDQGDENQQGQNQYQYQQGDYMQTWVAGYSLKFQGCHHVSQWNEESDEGDDVRIATKRLVRFRLCPSDNCNANNSRGCSSGYGDYVVDMNVYLAAYFEAKEEYQAFKCEYLESNVCYCNGNDGGDEEDGNGYSEDMCMWDCYAQHNMEGICMQNNPYNGDNGEDQQDEGDGFQIANYLECAQFSNGGNNDNNNNGQEGQEEGQYSQYNGDMDYYNWDGNYYVGPYCASQGGEIHLGMFLDDSCTTFADSGGGRKTFYNQNYMELPYGKSNMIDLDCFSCQEPVQNNNDGNDNQDGDSVAEICETIYTSAGKCEQNLAYGTVYSPNNAACNYLEGIKIVRKDGTVVTAESKANKTANVFFGLFAVMFVFLSMYVYFLKTKLDRASVNLNSEEE